MITVTILKNRKNAFLGVISLVMFMIILSAGLWPFTTQIKNDVKWLADKNGIIFQGRGIVYSHEPLTIPSHSYPYNNSITIELELQSKVESERHANHFHKSLWHYAEILSIGNASNISGRFTIGQWKSNLIIRSTSKNNANYKIHKGLKEIGIGNIFKLDEKLFLTITSDNEATSVYLNGKLVKSFPKFSLISINKAQSGRLLLGNSSSGKNPWKGNLFGLTIYNQSLTEKEVVQNYVMTSQLEPKPSSIRKGLIAKYLFDEHIGTSAKNSFREQYNLSIPEVFKRFEKKDFLLSPWIKYERDGLNIKDIIVNVIGFIPFSFFFSAFLFNLKNFSMYGAQFITLLLGGGTSLVIELLQFQIPTRTSSLTDLTSNIFGTILGILIFHIARSFSKRVQRIF